MDDKLTRKSQEALSDAVRRATADGNPHVEPLHLLAALVSQEGGIAAPLLRAVGRGPGRRAARRGGPDLPAAQGGGIHGQRAGHGAAAAGHLATAAKQGPGTGR